MKKKSSRRRTKMVRRSKKNPRRTIKRKNIRKSGRRPTRRYSRIQRGGDPYIDDIANKLYEAAMAIKTSSSPLNHRNISNIYKMLRAAAETGHKNANYELGKIYEEKSKKEKYTVMKIDKINSAIKKYAKAAIQGHDESKLALDRLFREEDAIYKEYITANKSEKNTGSYTFLAFKTLQNAALAAVALCAWAEKFGTDLDTSNALMIEKEVMQRFSEFADTFTNIETSENALDEVKKFKETLEKIGEKAPEQSVIAGADTGVD